MAKITITIEDLWNGNVKVVADPSCEQMISLKISGGELTAAHGYAFCAINAIQKESRIQGRPRIRLPSRDDFK